MTEFLKFQKSNCKNCYKCIRNCPVKSIRFSGNQANVIADECILCGRCYVVCPQNAKKVADETEIVGVLLKEDAPVIASIAPSFAAYYEGCGISALQKALKKLGFFDAEETAIGATMVKREYEKLALSGERDIIITSCCHTINLLVEKYYPQLAGTLAPVVTPMQAHCADIKRRYPNAKTVFIGPCLSKKDEAALSSVDAALTFDELTFMLEKAEIELERGDDRDGKGLARLFPTTGGILKTLLKKNSAYTYLSIDGIENCKSVLNDIAAGSIHHCFIEMSSCIGSCIGGPIMEKYRNSPLRHYQAITKYAGTEDFDVEQPESCLLSEEHACIEVKKLCPSEAEINEILKKMGKLSPDDELNCGTCGYDTCRDKAIAVYQGKAEINMCLPYLMEKSERFSNNILDNTPNGIMVVNEACEIQQINPAAMRMLNINTRSDVLGGPVIRVMDPSVFIDTLNKGKHVVNKRDYYAEFDRYLELTIVPDKKSGNLISIFRDVTDEENERRSKEALSQQTVETADRVVDKQMRIVQEIASLLGETAAETKIALTKLKESISYDGK
ncbi:MAG TPA: [Fe-Fe] hydrogenase large subunit C-terminal domain-containing protein [Oscillospiraceae bacterium]|nr:[Fe-Fe] hydrogenase large subunit C-terminal domain-containing protein [Oscillospiraceae bacterium]